MYPGRSFRRGRPPHVRWASNLAASQTQLSCANGTENASARSTAFREREELHPSDSRLETVRVVCGRRLTKNERFEELGADDECRISALHPWMRCARIVLNSIGGRFRRSADTWSRRLQHLLDERPWGNATPRVSGDRTVLSEPSIGLHPPGIRREELPGVAMRLNISRTPDLDADRRGDSVASSRREPTSAE
jgi:hypothetical protein